VPAKLTTDRTIETVGTTGTLGLPVSFWSENMKIVKYLAVFIIVSLLGVFLLAKSFPRLGMVLLSAIPIDLGNEYKFYMGNYDEMTIRKNGEVVIGPMILSHAVASDVIAGLRLPLNYLTCNDGSYATTRLSNEPQYFIIETETDAVSVIASRENFVERLDSLGVTDEILLDYSKFDEVWERYAHFYEEKDYSTCEPTSPFRAK